MGVAAVSCSPGSLSPLGKRDAGAPLKGITATGRSKTRRDGNAVGQRGIGTLRAQSCQPSPGFRFKLPMSGSNALRPLTLFWE